MMKKIIFVTGNKGKASEFKQILKIPVVIKEADIDEVQSMDLEYVSKRKTEQAFRIFKSPLITDDVGVFIDAWQGFPGPFAKFILSTLGNKRILEILKDEENRKVTVKSAISYHDGEEIRTFIGEVRGTLSYEEKGNEGWGFDPIIIPEGYEKTFAQMGLGNKNKISHRRKALDKLKEFLDSKNKEKEI